MALKKKWTDSLDSNLRSENLLTAVKSPKKGFDWKLIHVQKRDKVLKRKQKLTKKKKYFGGTKSSSYSYSYFGADNPAMNTVPDLHGCMPGMPDDEVNIILYMLLELYSSTSSNDHDSDDDNDVYEQEKTMILK